MVDITPPYEGRKHLSLRDLVVKAYTNAHDKGFYDGTEKIPDKFLIPTKLALIHSEVSEALEEVRMVDNLLELRYNEGKQEGFPSELADIVIRVADLCGYLGIDLEAVIIEKMQYNATRPRKHGKVI